MMKLEAMKVLKTFGEIRPDANSGGATIFGSKAHISLARLFAKQIWIKPVKMQFLLLPPLSS